MFIVVGLLEGIGGSGRGKENDNEYVDIHCIYV
jgi:hypothetical protein